jgi:colicin import membrane protein
MWDEIISFLDALILHILLLAILLFSMEREPTSLFSSPAISENPVLNTMVDEKAVLAELERLKRDEEFKQLAQRTQEYALEQKKLEHEQFVVQERTYLGTLEQQQEEERQQLEVLKQHQLLEKEKLENLLQEKAKLKETDLSQVEKGQP